MDSSKSRRDKKKFLAILLIMEISRLPEIKMYWSKNKMYTNIKTDRNYQIVTHKAGNIGRCRPPKKTQAVANAINAGLVVTTICFYGDDHVTDEGVAAVSAKERNARACVNPRTHRDWDIAGNIFGVDFRSLSQTDGRKIFREVIWDIKSGRTSISKYSVEKRLLLGNGTLTAIFIRAFCHSHQRNYEVRSLS